MRRKLFGVAFVAVAIAMSGIVVVGCGHEARPYDVERLERKCGIVAGRELSHAELVCLSDVAGLVRSKRCPLDIREGTFGDPPGPVWIVRESCGDVGIVVARNGAIVGVEVGKAVAP